MVESRRTEPTSRKSEPEWQAFAQFIVYFERKLQNGVEEQRTKVVERTGVHHMESGDQAEWPGIAPQHACDWMLGRIPKQQQAAQPVARLPAAASPASDAGPFIVFAAVDQIQMYQPPRNSSAEPLLAEGQIFPSFVKADAPLRLEALFTFRSVGPHARARPVSCDVAFQARNRSTKEVKLLGTAAGKVKEDGSAGAAQLIISGLGAGDYSLQVMVTARDGVAGGGFGDVPFLRVV